MNYKKIIQYLKYELKGFFNYLFYKSRISVDIQSHVYASSYIKNPPIKYSSHSISNINHFINRLPKSLHKYFIVESEHPLSLTGYSRNYKISLSKINYVSSYLESDKCLKIIAPSFGWKREAKKYFNNYNNFSTKIEIIYPSCNSMNIKKTIKSNRIFKILHIGNNYWGKGTPIAIDVFRELRKIYKTNIEFHIVSNCIPDYINLDGLFIYKKNELSWKEKIYLYGNSDFFLFPCLQDSLGVYLECLSASLPIITTNIYDKNEFVLNNKTGYLHNTPLSLYDGNFGHTWETWYEFVQIAKNKYANGDFELLKTELVGSCIELIESQNKLYDFSNATRNFFIDKFSFSVKNDNLIKLYSTLT
jgi:glycosyltransferase involved in cell wall biosynthesis